MTVDPAKVRQFVEDINSNYENDTILNEFRNVVQHDDDRHEGDYIQIGLRTGLPKEFFAEDETYHNAHLAKQFATRIVEGEKRWIANSCIEAVEDDVKSVTSSGIPSFDSIVKGYRQTADPDHLLVPMYRELHKQVNEWIRRRGSFTGGGSIRIGSSEVDVHWLSTDMGIQNLVLVNSSYLSIQQKYGLQAEYPANVDVIDEYDDFSEGKKVICTFGRTDEDPEDFDFVYRSVLSKLNPSQYSAFVIEIPDSVDLTD